MPDPMSRAAGPGMAGRRCESCGGMMPPRTHRQTRPSDGALVCPSCMASSVSPRATAASRPRVDSPEYRKAYERGWRSSQRETGMDRADMRGEPDSWYDGYTDYAVGREKWHMLNCPDHPACEDPEAHLAAAEPPTTRYRMTPEELHEHLRVGHGWSAEEVDAAHPSDLHGLHVGLHEAGELYDWAPKPRHRHVSLSPVSGLQAVAHESSDDLEIMHCPWCGSGQVVAQSDGSIECGYCQRVFTVRLQPAFPAMPQSIDGQPYPPGQPGADPGMPGDEVPGQLPAGMQELPPGAEGEQEPVSDGSPPEEGEEDDVPAFLKGSALRTSAGAELGVDAFLRHLAVVESGYDETVLMQVREDSAR